MEIDNLKSAWQEIPTTQKGKDELNLMLKKNSHPILASIKKQLIIELLGFTALLFCYYSMFDGAEKPLFVNIIIAIAIFAPILHHLKGYQLQKQFRSSKNLREDLTDFAAKLKTFRIETLIARIIFFSGIMLFFTYNIEFSESKWLALVVILAIFSVQLFFSYKVWSGRINKLKSVLQEFSNYVG
ncbi:MAG: hypothetical protein REI64_13035 [Pedobacter sp.]|uniref:hypothetical protein n=1 Tax=Pedobacter sp. TaxID=1411316 RepID=UPI00280667E3|nr:hypothetical protein [Pedobacter sp.]MDQ8005722.1 hypothetical protein [Pedobacter sp.]